jgi:hypothetical protein
MLRGEGMIYETGRIQGKFFFSEEKKQKTFVSGARG